MRMASPGSELHVQSYELPSERVEVLDEEFGSGAYGKVRKVKFGGLICAGKILHDVLRGDSSSGVPVSRAPEWFDREREILKRLRHPNIVQFLGMTYIYEKGRKVPVMVMEYVPYTLCNCIEDHDHDHPLPERVKYSILRDVALGLCYLHSCDYIHRDLTASNVLLTPNMTAKITDLGMARNPNVGPSRMTSAPGNVTYMPPEVLIGEHYGEKIDIFSFGVLILHTFTGELPTPSKDSGDPVTRRADYFRKMGDKCSLTSLAKACLEVKPEDRPCADDILEGIEKNTPKFPPDSEIDNRVTMMNAIEQVKNKMKGKDDEMKALEEKGRMLYELVKSAYEKKISDSEYEKRISDLEREIKDKDEQIESLKMRRDDPLPSTNSLATSTSSIQSQPRMACKPGDKLICTQCPSLPHGMYDATAIVLDNTIYVGGGTSSNDMSSFICKYEIKDGGWDLLPRCPVTAFGLAKLAGRVIMVGGILIDPNKQVRKPSVQSDDISGKCFTLDEKSRDWKSSCPPMLTPRYSLTAMEYRSCLITCGGRTAKGVVNTVEIFQLHSGESGEWYVTYPLPSPYYGMSYTIIQDSCYLLGGESGPLRGTCKVLHASLTSLIQASVLGSFPHEFESMSPWHELQEDIPSTRATAASLGNSLLAVGGNRRKPKMICYRKVTNSWFELADLPDPNARVGPAVAELPTGELLIIGGATSSLDPQSTVHRGTLSNKS